MLLTRAVIDMQGEGDVTDGVSLIAPVDFPGVRVHAGEVAELHSVRYSIINAVLDGGVSSQRLMLALSHRVPEMPNTSVSVNDPYPQRGFEEPATVDAIAIVKDIGNLYGIWTFAYDPYGNGATSMALPGGPEIPLYGHLVGDRQLFQVLNSLDLGIMTFVAEVYYKVKQVGAVNAADIQTRTVLRNQYPAR